MNSTFELNFLVLYRARDGHQEQLPIWAFLPLYVDWLEGLDEHDAARLVVLAHVVDGSHQALACVVDTGLDAQPGHPDKIIIWRIDAVENIPANNLLNYTVGPAPIRVRYAAAAGLALQIVLARPGSVQDAV